MSKRRGQAYWQGHLTGWLESGLTQQAYCERHGLSKASFYRWREKQKSALAAKPLTLVPVAIEAPGAQGAVRLQSPGRWRIEVPGVGAAWLGALLRQLP